MCGEKRIKTSTKKERKNQHSFITGNNTTANDQLKILVIIYIFLQQRSCTHKAYQPPTTEENYNKIKTNLAAVYDIADINFISLLFIFGN